MDLEPEAKVASNIVIKALSKTRPDVGVVACLDVAVRILSMTGLDRKKAIEALKETLDRFDV